MRQSSSSATRALLVSLLGACALASLAATTAEAGPGRESVHILHAFAGGSDGTMPSVGLVRDAQGNLYGTTGKGGAYNDGVLYKITPDGSYRVLHAFGKRQSGAALPVGAPVLLSDGSLAGTAGRADGQTGSVIYKLSSKGQESVLHRFGADDPLGYNALGLVADAAGNLYGATSTGGPSNCGTVFRLHADGATDLIYAFKGGASDGCKAAGPMTFDAAGNLYGVTGSSVFSIAPDGTETVLHMFAGVQGDGANPYGPVTLDAAGNLYGTTMSGHDSSSLGGTVYKIARDGTETVLQRFPSGGYNTPNEPVGGVIVDADSNLYGTTLWGGHWNNGVVFKLSPDGEMRILHSFHFADGANPLSLIFGANGTLVGANQLGVGYEGNVFQINMP